MLGWASDVISVSNLFVTIWQPSVGEWFKYLRRIQAFELFVKTQQYGTIFSGQGKYFHCLANTLWLCDASRFLSWNLGRFYCWHWNTHSIFSLDKPRKVYPGCNSKELQKKKLCLYTFYYFKSEYTLVFSICWGALLFNIFRFLFSSIGQFEP